MSQSRFSIVLVGVSALLRRPLVSRLRSADGERSPWVVFAARRRLPFRHLPLGRLTFGLPLRGCPRRVGASASRFGDGRSAGWPSGSPLPLFGTHRFGVAARRVGLRAYRFRFSACTASGLPSAGWPSGSPLPLFGMRRFGVAARRVGLRASVSAFRHAPLRSCPRRVGSATFRFGDCRSAGWPSGSRLPLFGMRRSAPPCRRSEGRRSTPIRHLFHFKTLIPTC